MLRVLTLTNFVVFLAALLKTDVYGSLPVVFPVETWPFCLIGDSTRGKCERLVECPQAVEAVYRGLHPPSCFWERHQTFPLVCCPNYGSLDSVLEPEATPVVIPVHPDNKISACGRVDEEPTSSGDSTSSSYNHVWPWMVSIYKDGEGKIPVGSGFLIDDVHVLSAAQNFPPVPQKKGWTVRLERAKRDETGAEVLGDLYTSQDVRIHEGFRSWIRYDDLALITLDEPVKGAQPLCLPPKDFDPNSLAGVNATILGTQRSEEVPIVSSSWCSEMYSKFLPLSYPRGVNGDFFCAGLQLEDQPLAPSVKEMGGPVMTQAKDGSWMAIGLVSLDYKCTQQGLPGVYLNLAHYKDWIEEQRASLH